jgi:hypothetical protein
LSSLHVRNGSRIPVRLGARKVQFAKLDGHPTLDSHDFLFV